MRLTLEETLGLLRGAGKIVVTSHENPDGDAIGSSLALARYLTAVGKKATVMIDDEISPGFKFMPGVEEITAPEEGCRYDADLLVVLDASLDRGGRVTEAVSAPILNIDHHPTNDGKAERLYLDGERAATAEIIYQLLELAGAEFDKEMAMAIYMGLATDTGFFRFSNTNPLTLQAAARMLEAGAEPHVISESLEQRPYSHVKGLADALQHIELWHDGRAAGAFLSYEVMESIEATDGLIDMLRVIEGVEIAVVMKYKEEGKARVSMRSKGVDVSRVAMQFGGGGHVKAAGCGIEKPFDEAKELLQKAIDEALATTDPAESTGEAGEVQ